MSRGGSSSCPAVTWASGSNRLMAGWNGSSTHRGTPRTPIPLGGHSRGGRVLGRERAGEDPDTVQAARPTGSAFNGAAAILEMPIAVKPADGEERVRDADHHVDAAVVGLRFGERVVVRLAAGIDRGFGGVLAEGTSARLAG